MIATTSSYKNWSVYLMAFLISHDKKLATATLKYRWKWKQYDLNEILVYNWKLGKETEGTETFCLDIFVLTLQYIGTSG